MKLKIFTPVTQLYLFFLDFYLPHITNSNKEFQAETPKIHDIML